MDDKETSVGHALAHSAPNDSEEGDEEDSEESDEGDGLDEVNPHTDMPHTEVTPPAHEVTHPLTFVSIVEQATKDGVSSEENDDDDKSDKKTEGVKSGDADRHGVSEYCDLLRKQSFAVKKHTNVFALSAQDKSYYPAVVRAHVVCLPNQLT
jgi:hypothetical protein